MLTSLPAATRGNPTNTPVRQHDAVFSRGFVPRLNRVPDVSQNRFMVFGMNHGEELFQIKYSGWRQTEHFVCFVRRPDLTGVRIQSPQSGVSRSCSEAQSCFALSQLLLCVLTLQRVGEYLRNELQPFLQRLRPIPLLFCRVEAQHAKHWAAACR